ncbi:DUF6384 family protein [Cucumibacter marinus]|uniref:DUF6384 family protein n=1 Tax=Cucumibacter marinus TaxID=1121252 RepID=UPI000418111A|nr:DUF6384 family protein [Cucumibacter marinus]
MTDPSTKGKVPLDDIMMAMDVVDTLRHREDLVERELDADKRSDRLVEKLRGVYAEQGIEVPDRILAEGVSALDESRFVYTPPKGGLGLALARLYVSRGKWGPLVAGIVLALVLGVAAYQFAYKPYVASQEAALERQLSVELPAEFDAVYDAIYTETKEQRAVREAEDLVTRGKGLAEEGDLEGAQAALSDLKDIRDTLRLEYKVTIVNRPDTETGVWTFPEVNTEATNYYLIVEALNDDGEALTLPIQNEESGEIVRTSIWGQRVPEAVYNAVRDDKLDDGIIQRNVLGVKTYGFLEVNYATTVLDGTITEW